MCGSMVDIQCAAAEIRRGKKEDRNYRMKIYMVSLLHRATIISNAARPWCCKQCCRHCGSAQQSTERVALARIECSGGYRQTIHTALTQSVHTRTRTPPDVASRTVW